MTRRFTLVVSAVALVVASCTSNDGEERSGTTVGSDGDQATDLSVALPAGGTTGPADWTFLVYVIGDTDLEPFALFDLAEMAAVDPSDRVNIVALVDRHPKFSDDGILNVSDWEDTKLLLVERDGFTELAGGQELNLGSADTLAAFVEAGLTTFPAERSALVFWDHGGGWLGMGPDETDGLDILDMADISEGLRRGLDAAGVSRLDLIGFDACLMSTYAVANVVAPYGDFLLSSQELEPGHGWNYEALSVITENPTASPVELGDAIISGFAEQANTFGTGSDITLSLLDLRAVENFTASFGSVVEALQADPAELGPTLVAARRDVLAFGRNPDPQLDANMVDLGQLLDHLASGTGDVASAATAARSALDAAVVSNTTGPATVGASGLAIYFPEQPSTFRQGYLLLEGVPHWADTLTAFYTAGNELPANRRASFVEVEDPDEGFLFDEDGLTVFGPLDELAVDSIVDASILVGLFEDDGGAIFFAEEPADVGVFDGIPGIEATYDLSVLAIADGVEEALVFRSVHDDPETGFVIVDIPMQYVAPGGDPEGEDVILSLIIEAVNDDEGIVVEEDFYLIDESGTWGELVADPEGRIFPLVPKATTDGDVGFARTTPVGLAADLPAIEYIIEPLPSGTQLLVDLTAADYGDTSDSIVFAPIIP